MMQFRKEAKRSKTILKFVNMTENTTTIILQN